jgi:hypothetical protein
MAVAWKLQHVASLPLLVLVLERPAAEPLTALGGPKGLVWALGRRDPPSVTRCAQKAAAHGRGELVRSGPLRDRVGAEARLSVSSPVVKNVILRARKMPLGTNGV